MVSCEEEGIPLFDTENGRSIAGFNGGAADTRVVFNPAENTESILKVGVSTLSSSDRSVSVSVDAASTLDPSFYTINTLTPVIPAGEFTADIVITTIPGASLPGASDAVILNLDSVEGAEILDNSISTLAVGLDVQCPSVEISALAGSYNVVALGFAGFFGETDLIGVNEDGIDSAASFGPNFYRLLPGGRVLTCVGIIEMTLDFSANIAGNPHVFNLVKQ